MANISNSLQQELASVVRGKNIFIALFKDDPEGGGTELTSSIKGVATRPELTTKSAVKAIGSGFGFDNTSDFEFVSAAQNGSTEQVDYVVAFDAATGGQMLFKGAISLKNIDNADPVIFKAGKISFSIE